MESSKVFDVRWGRRFGVAALLVVAAAAGNVGAQEPDYLLKSARAGCLGTACGPFRVVDLALESLTGDAAGRLRFTLGDRWLMGFAVAPGERSAEMRSARFRLQVEERDNGGAVVAARWHGSRWEAASVARRRADVRGGGWQLATELAYRAGPDLRLSVEFERDLQARPPVLFEARPWGRGRIGVRWQRGSAFELRGGVEYTRLRSGLDERLERWGADMGATWQGQRLRAVLGARLEDERGRFDRRDVLAALSLELLTFDRLVASVGILERVELGRVERTRDLSAGLELYGRRYRFERGGETARALEELVDVAWREGFALDRVYDLEGLRRLRERLRLAGRDQLTGALERLHAAQVRDRRVSQLALRWRTLHRPDVGSTQLHIEGSVGLPWPLAWPWSAGERRVELARASFRYREAEFGLGVVEIGRGATLELWPHRELGLRVGWEQPVRTPLELALGIEPGDRLELLCRYVFSR